MIDDAYRTRESPVYSNETTTPKQNASAMQLSKSLNRSANLLSTFEAGKKKKQRNEQLLLVFMVISFRSLTLR